MKKVSMIRKYHNHTLQTISRHREEVLHDTRKTNIVKRHTLFPIKIIAKLERTHSNVEQNMEQAQNPTMGAIINKESTTTESLPKSDQSLLCFFFVRKSNIVRTSV